MALMYSATRYKQKYFSIRDHHLAENLILVFVCKKGQREDKSKFVTKSVGKTVTIIFVQNVSQIAGKTFATECFFTDFLNHKTVNKTTCSTPSANSRQLWVH